MADELAIEPVAEHARAPTTGGEQRMVERELVSLDLGMDGKHQGEAVVPTNPTRWWLDFAIDRRTEVIETRVPVPLLGARCSGTGPRSAGADPAVQMLRRPRASRSPQAWSSSTATVIGTRIA